MAIDRLEIKSLLLHGIVFDCVMAVVEQVVNALRQEIVRGHLFFVVIFFRNLAAAAVDAL